MQLERGVLKTLIFALTLLICSTSYAQLSDHNLFENKILEDSLSSPPGNYAAEMLFPMDGTTSVLGFFSRDETQNGYIAEYGNGVSTVVVDDLSPVIPASIGRSVGTFNTGAFLNVSNVDLSSSSFSIGTWIQMDNSTGALSSVLSSGGSAGEFLSKSGAFDTDISYNSSTGIWTLTFTVNNTSILMDMPSDLNFEEDAVFVVISYDSNNSDMTMNAGYTGSISSTPIISATAATTTINDSGSVDLLIANGMIGRVDTTVLWLDKVLSNAEVTELFFLGSPKFTCLTNAWQKSLELQYASQGYNGRDFYWGLREHRNGNTGNLLEFMDNRFCEESISTDQQIPFWVMGGGDGVLCDTSPPITVPCGPCTKVNGAGIRFYPPSINCSQFPASGPDVFGPSLVPGLSGIVNNAGDDCEMEMSSMFFGPLATNPGPFSDMVGGAEPAGTMVHGATGISSSIPSDYEGHVEGQEEFEIQCIAQKRNLNADIDQTNWSWGGAGIFAGPTAPANSKRMPIIGKFLQYDISLIVTYDGPGSDTVLETSVRFTRLSPAGNAQVYSAPVTGTTYWDSPHHLIGRYEIIDSRDARISISVDGVTTSLVIPRTDILVPNSANVEAFVVGANSLVTRNGYFRGWIDEIVFIVEPENGFISQLDSYNLLVKGDSFIRGDVNNDGLINIADANSILDVIFPPAVEISDCHDSYDTNDSSTIDLADAIYLLDWLFVTNSPPPPSPFPNFGQDPGDGPFNCAQSTNRTHH